MSEIPHASKLKGFHAEAISADALAAMVLRADDAGEQEVGASSCAYKLLSPKMEVLLKSRGYDVWVSPFGRNCWTIKWGAE